MLETFSSIGVRELIVVKNFDTPFHPGVNEALICKFTGISEAHWKCGAARVLPIGLLIREFKLGWLNIDVIEGNNMGSWLFMVKRIRILLNCVWTQLPFNYWTFFNLHIFRLEALILYLYLELLWLWNLLMRRSCWNYSSPILWWWLVLNNQSTKTILLHLGVLTGHVEFWHRLHRNILYLWLSIWFKFFKFFLLILLLAISCLRFTIYGFTRHKATRFMVQSIWIYGYSNSSICILGSWRADLLVISRRRGSDS